MQPGIWKLKGYDTFSKDYYALEGEFAMQPQAIVAAQSILAELELEQPSESSGGQDGIQDQVFVIRPDGSMFRV